MWRAYVVLAVVCLAACFSSVSARHFAGPDGQTSWWNIQCERDDSLCWRQASEQCPSGYDAVDLSPRGTALVYARKTRAGEMFGERRVNDGKLVVHCTDGVASALPKSPSVDDVTPPPSSAGDGGTTRALGGQH